MAQQDLVLLVISLLGLALIAGGLLFMLRQEGKSSAPVAEDRNQPRTGVSRLIHDLLL